MWKPLSSRRVLKTLRGSLKGKAKTTIFASGELGPLQMVSELDIGRCASEKVEPRRGVDRLWCANKDVRPRRGVDLVGVSH